jgi:hypothetical protein
MASSWSKAAGPESGNRREGVTLCEIAVSGLG